MRIISTRIKYFTGGHNELRTGQLSTGDPERSSLTRFVCWPAGGWSGPAADCCQLWDPAQTPPYNTSTAHTLTGWTEVIQDNSNRITSKYHLINVVLLFMMCHHARYIFNHTMLKYIYQHFKTLRLIIIIIICIMVLPGILTVTVTLACCVQNRNIIMCYVQRKVRFQTKKVL